MLFKILVTKVDIVVFNFEYLSQIEFPLVQRTNSLDQLLSRRSFFCLDQVY